jgi:hypothetical protein
VAGVPAALDKMAVADAVASAISILRPAGLEPTIYGSGGRDVS